MSRGRPSTPEGAYGKISFIRVKETGPTAVRAQARFKPSGGGKSISIYGFGKSKAAAERNLKTKAAERSKEAGWRGDKDATIADIVPQWYEELVAHGEIKFQTHTEYLRVVNTTVIPKIGGEKLKDLNPGRVTRFLQSLIVNRTSGYALADNCRVVLSSIMTWAVNNAIIPANPVRDASAPKRPVVARPAPRALSISQVQVVREACRKADNPPPNKSGAKTNMNLIDGMDLLISTGLRIGELMGLTWDDIDLISEPATVTVCGTYVDRTEENTPESHRQQTPKTPTSVRTIALDDFAVALLLERLHRPQPGNIVNAVFPSRSGGFFTPNGFRNRWRTVRDSLGPEYAWVTPHSLRDTVATAVAESHGVQTAADLLGHHSPTITRKYYWDRSGSVAPNVTGITSGLRGAISAGD